MMKDNNYLTYIEKQNSEILLNFYIKQMEKIRTKIIEAIKKANNIDYLESLEASMAREISRLSGFFSVYSKQQTQKTYLKGMQHQDSLIKKLLEVSLINNFEKFTFGNVNKEAVSILSKAVSNPLAEIAQNVGRQTKNFINRTNWNNAKSILENVSKFADNDFLQKVGLESVEGVIIGSETWQNVAKKIEKALKDVDIFKIAYYDKSGNVLRKVKASTYANMVARTTTANILRQAEKDRILEVFEDDGDLVEIIGLSQNNESPCVPYQGKILSLNGDTKGYTTIEDAKLKGLFHPNCIHTFGVTENILNIYKKMSD